MAKSGKPNPRTPAPAAKPKSPAAPTPAAKVSTPPRNWLLRPEQADDNTLRKVFLALAGVILLGMLLLSLGSGVNADDKFQVDYSTKLVNYYGTFGRDTAALNIPDGKMHLYGGFFEIVTGFSNKALGFQDTEVAYHQVRHAWSAFFGWVAIFCAALLARLIAGWRAGIVTLVIMALSPRFVGDALMNPKDIPFAAGYIMAVYNLAAVLVRMPSPRRRHLAGLTGGLAIALATRAGGLLPFAYLFLFGGLHFLLSNGGFRAFSDRKLLTRYLLIALGVAASAYVLAILFWPYALQSPLKNPLVALSKFADLEVKIRVLYEGKNMMSDKTPWHYPLKWMLYTIPLAALAGLFASVLLLPRLLRKYDPLLVVMTLFAGVFPVFYIVYQNSVIHDGWRHLTFAYAPLAVLAGLAWNELATLFSAKKTLQYATFGVLGLLLADSAWFIAANRHYPYVYFNPLAGGMKGAFGQFETDYWGISTRQGIEWLEQEGILRPDMTETVIIATNMHFSAKQFLGKYGDKVKLKYLKWERRCDDAWDYALYPTRFLDGSTLQRGKWPPDNTVHLVEANGVPLLAVLKDSNKACAMAVAASKVSDWALAIENFNREVALVPDNELAWAGLAQAYLNVDSLEQSKSAAEKALDISPDDSQANNVIGLYWIQKNDVGKAKSQFELAVKRDASNAAAWYYLALIARGNGEQQAALNHLRKCIQTAPTFKPAYELSAQIYEEAGSPADAQRFRAAAAQIR